MPVTDRAELLTYAGPLAIPTAIWIGLIAIGILGALLWREKRVAGINRCQLFFALRLIALAALLWMLVGPTTEITDSEAGVGTVAILADRSSSMDVIDSPRVPTDLRWSLSENETDQGYGHLAAADRANVACGIAGRHVQRAAEALQAHQPSDRIVESLRASERALSGALKHLESAGNGLATDGRQRMANRASQLHTDLASEIYPILIAYQKQFSSGSEIVAVSTANDLSSLATDIATMQRRLGRFADQVGNDLADSPSTAIDRIVGTTARQPRIEKIRQTLAHIDDHVASQLAETTRVKRFQFDESLTPVSAAAWTAPKPADGLVSAPATDLTRAMEQLGQDADAASIETVILLSDGRHNARNRKTPVEIAALNEMSVYVVPVGDTNLVKDVSLYRVDAPSVVIHNDTIVIDAIVMATDMQDEVGMVELLRDGQILETREAHFESVRADVHLSFTANASELGRHEFELRIQPLPDESSDTNNTEQFEVEVTTATISVLLADDRPRFEYQFLRNLLNRSETIEADELLFSPEPSGTGARKDRPAFPQQVDQWSRYRAIILGDVTPDQLDPRSQQSMSEWVRKRGGAVIVIAGTASMPAAFRNQELLELLPVQENFGIRSGESFLPKLTSEGNLLAALALEDNQQRNAETWHRIYRRFPIRNLSQFSQPKPSGHTLLAAVRQIGESTDGAQAFLCWHPVGRGRVVYLAAPETFRLRFRNGDLYHHRFWGQLIRWATASNLAAGTSRVRIRTDKDEYTVDEPIQIEVQLRDDEGVPVAGLPFQVVASSAGAAAAVVDAVADASIPGRYTGALHGLSTGNFQLSVKGAEVEKLVKSSPPSGTAETQILVSDAPNVEMVDTRCDRALLSQIADVTGGQVIPPTAIMEVLRLAVRPSRTITSQQSIPLWNQWWLLSIIFACLLTEWTVRKRIGLV